MSWIDVEPVPDNAPAAVKVGISLAGERYAQRMTIMLRPALIEGAAWLQLNAPVRVQLGRDENAGTLRITPGGRWKLTAGAGRQTSGAIRINLPSPHEAPLMAVKMVAVEFDYGDDWLELTLPAMRSLAATAASAATAPPAKPTPVQAAAKASGKSAPYVGVSARVPDQATVLSQQLGRKVR